MVCRSHANRGEAIRLAEKPDRSARPKSQADQTQRDVAMGAALRTVYQKTVEESVPDEFLDLLSKLD